LTFGAVPHGVWVVSRPKPTTTQENPWRTTRVFPIANGTANTTLCSFPSTDAKRSLASCAGNCPPSFDGWPNKIKAGLRETIADLRALLAVESLPNDPAFRSYLEAASAAAPRPLWHPFHDSIRLHVIDRISADDAARQETTARAILARFAERPGLVLADEVGMGKTFVALAVAASVALSDRKRPVVVMVPPSLKEKWPRDFGVFVEQCLPEELRNHVRCASAETGVQFLKRLDDSPERRASLIFLTHGAMSRTLTDGWVRLAIIHRALYRRQDQRLRGAGSRCAASLVEVASRTWRQPELCPALLAVPPETWLAVMRKHGYEAEDGDDPVPGAVIEALRDFETHEVYAALDQHIPRNKSDSYEERLKAARAVLRESLKDLWTKCLRRLEFKLPLLILDEAHHLKNARTELAQLFHSAEAEADAEMLKDRGPLGGVFERMLFLTATPFQLGHHELCSVLERFEGVAWDSKAPPPGGRTEFRQQVATLRERLDAAQEAALTLDAAWGQLRQDDLMLDGEPAVSVERWWEGLASAASHTPQAERVLASFQRTHSRMRAAEESLHPWVIRHLRSRTLPAPWLDQVRRVRVIGRAIVDDIGDGPHHQWCSDAAISPRRTRDGLRSGFTAGLCRRIGLELRSLPAYPERRSSFGRGLGQGRGSTAQRCEPVVSGATGPCPPALRSDSIRFASKDRGHSRPRPCRVATAGEGARLLPFRPHRTDTPPCDLASPAQRDLR